MIYKFLAKHLRKPTGFFGKYVITRIMNRINEGHYVCTLKNLDLQPDDRLLEVGFGGGELLERIVTELEDGWIAGIDFSYEAVLFCEKRLSSYIKSGKMEIIHGDVNSIPYPVNHFSKVYSINSIYFWPDISDGFKEIKRILRNEGLVSIGFTPKESLQRLPVTKYGFTCYTSEEVRDAMKSAGFTDIKIEEKLIRGETICNVSGKS